MIKKYHPKLIVAIRIFLGLIFLGAGMSKLYFEHSFPGIIGPVWLEERLAEHGLGMYARFIASSQVIAGLLLLTQRFATLGAIITFPLILNILMVTVSMKWQGTPYVNAFFLLLNVWLLIYDYHKLKFIITDQPQELKAIALKRTSVKADKVWALAVIGIVVSIPLSYQSLQLAWVLCGLMIILIIWNQFRKKE